MKTIERRAFKCESRTASTGKPRIRGHAAVFDTWAPLGAFKEMIKPGAFKRTLSEDAASIMALWNHNADFPLARLGYGLTLSEDATGLACEIEPDLQTTTGRDVSRYVENKSVRGMSIGFIVPTPADQRIDRRDGEVFRTITRVKLLDVSAVVFPAYTSTDISLRSALEVAPEILAAVTRKAETPADRVLAQLTLENLQCADFEARLHPYRRRLTLLEDKIKFDDIVSLALSSPTIEGKMAQLRRLGWRG